MRYNEKSGFSTKQIHAGRMKDNNGSLCAPIYMTAMFEFDTVEQGGKRFSGEEGGHIYTRLTNPSLERVEEKVRVLEGGEACVATASGMGAISAALWTLVSAGDQIIADDCLYGCTCQLLTQDMPRFNIDVQLTDFSDPENLKKMLSPKTKVVYFETPCNPTMKVIDIEAIAKIAHEYNPEIQVVVDNTFCSPYLQRPLDWGADIVVHSATKYLNGHGDVIAGFIIGSKEFLTLCRATGIKNMTGCIMSPFSAFLIERGMKTLSARMKVHCENAKKVAEFLVNHPAVDKVYYPGLESFKGHEIAKKQMKDYGGMMSIEIKAGREAVAAALNKLQMITIAVSLGDAETLVEHAASMTHSVLTSEQLKEAGISEGLVRISVGMEDPEDIIADLKQALDTLL